MSFLRTLGRLLLSSPTPPRCPACQCQLEIWKQWWMKRAILPNFIYNTHTITGILPTIITHDSDHNTDCHFNRSKLSTSFTPLTTILSAFDHNHPHHSPLLLSKLPLPVLIVLSNILNQLRTVCIFWGDCSSHYKWDEVTMNIFEGSPFQASNMSWMKKS